VRLVLLVLLVQLVHRARRVHRDRRAHLDRRAHQARKALLVIPRHRGSTGRKGHRARKARKALRTTGPPGPGLTREEVEAMIAAAVADTVKYGAGVALRAHAKQVLCAELGGPAESNQPFELTSRAEPGPWETWTIERVG
jgi:hypothetical protein